MFNFNVHLPMNYKLYWNDSITIPSISTEDLTFKYIDYYGLHDYTYNGVDRTCGDSDCNKLKVG